MKKVFTVEINYEEAKHNKNNHVLYPFSLEMAVENYLEEFVKTNNIHSDFTVSVEEATIS